MTSFMPMQPGQGLLRVSLLGPMGIGKTTALRSLCGELMAGSDVRNLDKAALQHVLKTWRFKPAMQDGQAVQAYGLVPIAVSLQ